MKLAVVGTLAVLLPFSAQSGAAAEPPPTPRASPAEPAVPTLAEIPAEEVAAAQALYRAANVEYSLGRFREALEKFEAAFRARQSPALLFNIAQCHRQLKEFEQAASTYRAFLRSAPPSARAKMAASLLEQVEEASRAQEAARKAPPIGAAGEDTAPQVKRVEPSAPAEARIESQRPAPVTGAVLPAPASPPVATTQRAPAAQAAATVTRPAAPAGVTGEGVKPPPEPASRNWAWWGAGGAAVVAAAVVVAVVAGPGRSTTVSEQQLHFGH